MSQDSFTETTNQSWFSRLGDAAKGVMFGLALFGVSFVVLFWNEGRAVKRHRALSEGAASVITVPADRVNNDNAGKLICISGTATTEETLTDPIFGVTAKAIHLKRQVEIYQWKEETKSSTEKKLGGGTETVTTYTYEKTWENGLTNSSGFKHPEGHQNPSSALCASSDWTASNTHVGAFQLSSDLVNQISQYTPPQVAKTSATFPGQTVTIQPNNTGIYVGANPATPQIGDMRITFQEVLPLQVSVVARQTGSSLESYTTKAGGSIALLSTGVHSAAEMFQAAESSNQTTTWLLRAVGFFLMFFGLNSFFKPLSVLADVLPILGTLVAAGTGFVSLLISATLSLITIAIAWVVYRPLVGISILVIALIFGILTVTRLKRRKTQALPT